MRLCYGRLNDRVIIGLAKGDAWVNLTQVMRDNPDHYPWIKLRPEPTMVDLLENTPDLTGELAEVVSQLEGSGKFERYLIKEEIQLLAPVTNPSKIIALGLNYLAHAEEGGFKAPEAPIIFAKAPSAIIGEQSNIVYPDVTTRLDPEIELGIVIGRKGRFVVEREAMDYIAGYTIINDVTDRDMQSADLAIGNPWFRSKSFDTFCPMGPYLVLKDEVTDPHKLELTLRVNGEVRQHSFTSRLIFKIHQIIAFISAHMTLKPGDIISTGTPEGIAPLKKGDLVECKITHLGTLSNRVV
jgi:5-oxopent-3-ene-1,2,5-tricarboxylate decarboxylase/2-hydroxyhepta-2,4-diene-1,7-dioate isomerase